MATITPLVGARASSELATVGTLDENRLPVDQALAELLPNGIPRGIVASVDSPSLLLTLLAEPTAAGSWVAVVGQSNLCMLAAEEFGVCLKRCLIVPEVNGNWPAALAALIDSVDIVVINAANAISARDARRLSARARERRCLLVLANKTAWPDSPALSIETESVSWEGLAEYGKFVKHSLLVKTSGRGSFSRPTIGSVSIDKRAS